MTAGVMCPAAMRLRMVEVPVDAGELIDRPPPLVSAQEMCCSSDMRNDTGLWPAIGVFLAVYREGSALAAARRLGISQATVTRRLDALEAACGLPLFARDTRGMRPTRYADDLAAAAARVGDAAGAFLDLAEDMGRSARRTIRIAAPGPNFSKGFTDILAEFSDGHGDVAFSLLPSDQAIRVGEGEADIALLYTNRIDDERLVCRRVGVEQTTFYASRTYLALNGLPRTRDDWRGHAVVGIDGTRLPPKVAEWIAERARPGSVTARCQNIASLIGAIRMGKGMGPLPVTLGDGIEDIERCFEPPDALDLPIWLVVSPEAYRRESVRDFVGFLGPRLAALLRG
jgi:DNA-binding transcriptional LysR family regulator